MKSTLPRISIDKLSFTARIGDYGQASLVDYLSNVPYEVEYRQTAWNFMYQHQWNFKACGLFIQTGRYNSEDIFRMEFNPNKVQGEYISFIHRICQRLKYPNITRIDWAVDYEQDMSQYEFKQLTSRSTIEYKSRGGHLETLYIGSPKSDNFIRIYNKGLEKKKHHADPEEEVKVKETLWRVEAVVKDFTMQVEKDVKEVVEHPKGRIKVERPRTHWISGKDHSGRTIVKEYQLKPEIVYLDGYIEVEKTQKVGVDYLFQNPFKNIEVRKKHEGGSIKLKQSEKAMLFFLDHNPDEWAYMSKNTRKKYEDLRYMYTWHLIEDQPREVFEKQKNRLAEELESWLKPALDNSTFLTGYKSNYNIV